MTTWLQEQKMFSDKAVLERVAELNAKLDMVMVQVSTLTALVEDAITAPVSTTPIEHTTPQNTQMQRAGGRRKKH